MNTAVARERLVIGVLLLGVACWMTAAHWQQVDIAKLADKERLHAQVLDNAAEDPYQYKLWLIESVIEHVRVRSGASLQHLWMANTLLSLLLLVVAHHVWLRRHAGPRNALVGGLLLGALANALFLIYYHHSYEFWGVGVFCILLTLIDRDTAWWAIALVCLAAGLVWEKHALLAVVWGVRELLQRKPFLVSFGKGLVILAAALAVPLLVRWHLGAERGYVDGDTSLAGQSWIKVLWFQAPYVVPFLLLLACSWRRQPVWIRLLWLYLPVLAAAYLSQHFIVHEVRSFWALAPVFTATFVVWLGGPSADAAPAPAPAPPG